MYVSSTSATDHIRHGFKAFDTLVVLELWGDGGPCTQAAERVEELCRECESLFSRTIDTSDVGRLNHARGSWVDVDERTVDLLASALRYCKRSKGAFDITVGPLVSEWDFRNGVVPKRQALEEAVRHVGWRKVEIDSETNRVRLMDPDAMVDLGGIAKGWIADSIRDEVRGADDGIVGMIANLGGNVVVAGSNPDKGAWRVGVRDPRRPSQSVVSMTLDSGSLVTSGTYERSFKRDGTLHHHILDPTTGWPVETDLASATLVCERSIDAEGFSTTVLALGMKEGSVFVREAPEIEHACLIGMNGELRLM